MIAGQSLLVQGMASRLPGYAEEYDLRILHPDHENWMEELLEAEPSVLVMDAQDPQARKVCPLVELMWKKPNLTVMLLSSEHSDLQVISSKRFSISDSQALMEQILATQ